MSIRRLETVTRFLRERGSDASLSSAWRNPIEAPQGVSHVLRRALRRGTDGHHGLQRPIIIAVSRRAAHSRARLESLATDRMEAGTAGTAQASPFSYRTTY